ncbi:MAG: hypothetical protein IK017_02675 [Paludibacteraceae bacterium]|nr:hypothetical protein [Paludibacteraceae bacterium]MBR5971539.1 hypothetical protein [Paludibacteraceae bacterium]
MKQIALIILLSPLFFLFSCESGVTNGIADDEIFKEDILGGWRVTKINCQLVYNTADPLASLMPVLKTKMQENLEKRISDGSILFLQDTVYYIETPAPGISFVRAYGHYEMVNSPGILFMENTHLICDAYATYFYVKKIDNQICLYLTREGALAMIKDDGSLNDYIGLIQSKIEDAQFEFYLEPYHLDFYDEIIHLYD